MNDSFTSSWMRRGRIRSRLFGAVIFRGKRRASEAADTTTEFSPAQRLISIGNGAADPALRPTPPAPPPPAHARSRRAPPSTARTRRASPRPRGRDCRARTRARGPAPRAPNTIANAVVTMSVATPSSCSDMNTASTITPPFPIARERRPAVQRARGRRDQRRHEVAEHDAEDHDHHRRDHARHVAHQLREGLPEVVDPERLRRDQHRDEEQEPEDEVREPPASGSPAHRHGRAPRCLPSRSTSFRCTRRSSCETPRCASFAMK